MLITGGVFTYFHYYRKTSSAASLGSTVVEYARTQAGKYKYVRGGCHSSYPIPISNNCGSQGFDCSGFARWAWYKAGVKIAAPNSSANWNTVAMWDNRKYFYHQSGRSYSALSKYLLPGDVLLFAYNGGTGKVHHAAIYTGNGYYIESTPSGYSTVREVKFTRTDAVGFIRPSVRLSVSYSSASSTPITYTASDNIPSSPPTIKLGSKGNIVATLQTTLNKVGGYGLVVDGIFGSKTNAAVRDFQSDNTLQVDGVVGPITWNALRNAL
jgi:hypothetical protein